jgi:pre-mRNA-splicing factor SYF1
MPEVGTSGAGAAVAGSKVTIDESDVLYEEDIQRNPYEIDAWLRYLDHKKAAPKEVRFRIYERGVKQLPGSYKLWYRYLKERRKAVRGLSPIDPARKEVNHAFVSNCFLGVV